LGRKTLAPPSEAHLFGSSGFQADGIGGHFQQFRHTLLHGLAIGLKAWGFRQQREIRVTHDVSTRAHQPEAVRNELVTGSAAPLRVRVGKMLADIAKRHGTEQGIAQGVQENVAI